MIDLTKKYCCRSPNYQIIAGPFYCSEVKDEPVVCAIKGGYGDATWCHYSENGYNPDWKLELIEVNLVLDQKILVSNNNKNWYHRHFAKFDSDGSVMAFAGGITSWSAIDAFDPDRRQTWKYWKIPVEDVSQTKRDK